MTLLTVKEYAAYKRVCRDTVFRWIRKKLIPAERTAGPKGTWRIRVDVDECRTMSPSPDESASASLEHRS